MTSCREMKSMMEQFKSVPCMDCVAEGKDGIWPTCAMQFDHVRGEKIGTVRSCIRFGNEEGFLAEVAKCEIVCANHHEIRTQRRGKSPESRKRMSAAQKEAQNRPEVRAKKSALISAAVTPEKRKRSSEIMTANWNNPEFRKAVSNRRRKDDPGSSGT